MKAGQVVPDHGRCMPENKECGMGRRKEWKPIFLFWVMMVSSDPTHFFILEKG